MSCRGSHEVSADNSLKTIEGLARTLTLRSSCCFDITRHARRYSIGARWCGGTPRLRARENTKGRGRACAAPLDGRGSWAVIQGVGLVGPAGAVPPASFANRFTGSTSGDAKPSPCSSCSSTSSPRSRDAASPRRSHVPRTIGHRPTRAASGHVEVHSKSHPVRALPKSPVCRRSGTSVSTAR